MSNMDSLLQNAIDASLQQTAASKEMSDEVRNKMGEIDQKVDQAVKDLDIAFSEKYKDYSIRKHYVDCVNGNDTNDGKSWGSAFETIQKALAQGEGAQSQTIYLSIGVHVVSSIAKTYADTVIVEGDNQLHWPAGDWSEDTSSVIHIDKRGDVKNAISTKLFGNLYVNGCVVNFEGNADSDAVENTAFYGIGNIGLRLPLFVFDSVKRGVMTAGSNYNPFSSLGAELPQFIGEAGYMVKGKGSTCILNMDRPVDRTSGMQQKSGSVIILS